MAELSLRRNYRRKVARANPPENCGYSTEKKLGSVII